MALGDGINQRCQPLPLAFTLGLVFGNQLVTVQGVEEKATVALGPERLDHRIDKITA